MTAARALPASTTTVSGDPAKLRVMVVEDSVVIRSAIVRLLTADPDIEVARTAVNGRDAIAKLPGADIDVAVLDIEMPEMDGLEALPRLLGIDRDLKVVMASTLTRRNAEISLKALAAGAADYVAKPTAIGEVAGESFAQELVRKVKALGGPRRRRRLAAGRSRTGPAAEPVVPPISLRPGPTRTPEVLAIGSSTGGPQAVLKVLGSLGRMAQPILVTQHMPPTFTQIFAEHIARATAGTAAEAVDGEPLEPGRIYVAPGDRHLTLLRRSGRVCVRLDDGPPESFCRPAVDPMLRSVADLYGSGGLALILTGMGQDGLAGARGLVERGGSVVAQDAATSVVWGMPGAVAKAGVCSAVLPLDQIARHLCTLMGRTRP